MSDNDKPKREALADQRINQKDTEGACKLLFDLIVEYAREKNFVKAEALHEKLYETDPMALTEIVRSSEIIEEEKSESLDREHIEIWSKLYEPLSTAEGNALYYLMKSKKFQSGEPIMEQGKLNSRLYFINRGEVKALFNQGGKENLIKILGVGDIVGQEPFFSATVCTVSMVPLNSVKATYLETDVLKKWKEEVPALESKLYDYCLKNDSVKKELAGKSIERRSDKRVNLSGTVVFQLLDKAGKPTGKGYKGELSDLSAGGISFIIKSSKKESVRMLLGRRLKISFNLPMKHNTYHKVEQLMTVIAAQPQVFDDYSIHLKFDTKWAQRMIEDVDPSRLAVKPDQE
ncbi:MAG: cyclic nucleotide-binding domain-containing protein [Desulfobacteraceae bacterium]|nr:cyclic nucleotide-binding domain-containing protein [Desulfobacteraceae bacterium]MBC2756619.1 cyclic nucleotide-binding domain-containing protein [Desulfobacteraceae bacterium]